MISKLTFKKCKSEWAGDIIRVYNKRKEKLGFIQYHKPWKKWIWEQELSVMMSDDCLQEIVDYMKIILRGD